MAVFGEEALARLADAPVDVVITDLALRSGMNGWEVAARVRDRWPRTSVALTTGWGGQIEQDVARERGIDVVIAKPYSADDLLRAVAETALVLAG